MNRYLRCYAEISLEAIGHNIREVKKRLPEGVKLLGVVKANAYGHGAVPVASYLENQVDYFATATIEEAVELRENGISAPILILGYVSPSQYGDLVEYDITQTIDSYAQALALEKEAARQNRKAKAHLAVDTGMTRIGFQVTEHDADEAAKIADLPHIELEGSVEECGVQGFAEWEVCGFHGIYSIADLSGSGDDVRDVDDQQTGNNADGQH